MNRKKLLLNSIKIFYKNNAEIYEKYIMIIQGKSSISLRLLDWFVTNYSKKDKTFYNLNNDSKFFVYSSYRAQLKAYSKKLFDPFCRRERICISEEDVMLQKKNNEDNESSEDTSEDTEELETNDWVETTVGQMNFFRWALTNNVIDYVLLHIIEIEKDMQLYNQKSKKNSKTKHKKNKIKVKKIQMDSYMKYYTPIEISFD